MKSGAGRTGIRRMGMLMRSDGTRERAAANRQAKRRVLRVGSVSFLNAKPLIYGLERYDDVELGLDVPSALLDDLRSGRFDVALLPVIDYQRMEGLSIVPAGGIGCDGPTLTVRIFSKVPIEQITRLACDRHSHTSVALARVVMGEAYGVRPELVEWEAGTGTACEARLLIGDKVVCEEPAGFEYQLDLGEAWKKLTGMPFVFAVWMARGGIDLRDLPERLKKAKREGLAHVREIVEEYGVTRGWPAGTAVKYLTEYLKFDVGERELAEIARFHELARKNGAIEGEVRGLTVYGRGPSH